MAKKHSLPRLQTVVEINKLMNNISRNSRWAACYSTAPSRIRVDSDFNDGLHDGEGDLVDVGVKRGGA